MRNMVLNSYRIFIDRFSIRSILMNGIFKALTAILGVLAILACLATIGIVGYSMTDHTSQNEGSSTKGQMDSLPSDMLIDSEGNLVAQASAVPTMTPDVQGSASPEAVPTPAATTVDTANHVHDYKETVVKKATCYSAGQMKYTCSICGDEYYVDIMSTGHVPDDWEVVRKPTATEEGLRVRKCIYCDEIVASEPIPVETTGSGSNADASATASPAHVHQYTATTEREPTCVLAGLRRYSCSCGSFYTEMIPAAGHIASDWTTVEEATSTLMGREQRTCVVCGVVLDSRPVDMVSPSPSASAGATASAAASGSPSASAQRTSSPSASPSPSAHKHNYVSYVLKEANCTERGIRSFVCSCGSSYAEPIELDLNNHTYRAVVIPATNTTQGYTIYTCIRCNSSYYDNYTPPLDPVYANAIAMSSASPSASASR